eukprot:gnl/TRDRNA2_/TRDRNA2_64853_c0_seq1.p1 gnl/TRDRNA2_/TRDRNA2_64853_c0~~gnl/TRDRNA2_/TRDRNA2_64853_c0_seq1.p1  ORF type:complete len:221 (-),score=15.92 gnl/TRDRNA2_/TRDRNA2_64853_c0_seq1:254-916(-)
MQAVVMARPLLYMNRLCSTRMLSRLDEVEGSRSESWFYGTKFHNRNRRIIDRKIMPFGRRVPTDIRAAVDSLRGCLEDIDMDDTAYGGCYGRLRAFVALPGEDASAQLFIQLLGLPLELQSCAFFEKTHLCGFGLPDSEDDGQGPGCQNEHAGAIRLLQTFGDTYRLWFKGADGFFNSSPVFWFAQQSCLPERAILGVMTTLRSLCLGPDCSFDEIFFDD